MFLTPLFSRTTSIGQMSVGAGEGLGHSSEMFNGSLAIIHGSSAALRRHRPSYRAVCSLSEMASNKSSANASSPRKTVVTGGSRLEAAAPGRTSEALEPPAQPASHRLTPSPFSRFVDNDRNPQYCIGVGLVASVLPGTDLRLTFNMSCLVLAAACVGRSTVAINRLTWQMNSLGRFRGSHSAAALHNAPTTVCKEAGQYPRRTLNVYISEVTLLSGARIVHGEGTTSLLPQRNLSAYTKYV
ncbi:hypothetical protein OH77DRAFT_494009 [Trametes cingulata]|nr:hypothetical protein OH77DRAFT_494009 [Trametes cingulata]